jgi:hypothetical protein
MITKSRNFNSNKCSRLKRINIIMNNKKISEDNHSLSNISIYLRTLIKNYKLMLTIFCDLLLHAISTSRLSMLNWSDISKRFCTVTIFLIIHMKIIHKFNCKFMIHLHTKFLMLNCNCLLVITVKPKASCESCRL